MGDILLPDTPGHEIGDKESAKVAGDSFMNHDLVDPFKVVEKASHITSSEAP